MAEYRVRTDLALEAKESVEEKNEQIRGVNVEEYYEPDSEIHITKVIVETKNGAKEIGKPMSQFWYAFTPPALPVIFSAQCVVSVANSFTNHSS